MDLETEAQRVRGSCQSPTADWDQNKQTRFLSPFPRVSPMCSSGAMLQCSDNSQVSKLGFKGYLELPFVWRESDLL